METVKKNLLKLGCVTKKTSSPVDMVKCSDSYIHKSPNRPFSLFVKNNALDNIKKRLTDIDDLKISGISIGDLKESGAWSKIKTFDIGRYVDISIISDDLFLSDFRDQKTKDRIKRIKRLINNYYANYEGINVNDIIEKELSKLTDNIERKIEKTYSDQLGESICYANHEVKKFWIPTKNDVIKFKINIRCVIPKEITDKIEESINSIGERESIVTNQRYGINSIFTPDKDMYLRKIVIYDKDIDGPYMLFGIKDKSTLLKNNIIDRINAMENFFKKEVEPIIL